MMDWETKAFHTFTGWQVNCFLTMADGKLLIGSKNYILIVDEEYLHDIDVDTGDRKAINIQVEGHDYRLGSVSQVFYTKFLNRFFFSCLQSDTTEDELNLTIELYSDYTQKNYNTDVNESLIWSRKWNKAWGFSSLVTQYADVNQKGFRFRPVFKASSLNNKFYVYSFGFEFDYVEATGTIIQKPLLISD